MKYKLQLNVCNIKYIYKEFMYAYRYSWNIYYKYIYLLYIFIKMRLI